MSRDARLYRMSSGTTRPTSTRMIAPPRREEIWAKGISTMRRDAESTATSPVPPILAMHRPAEMADSMKWKPTSTPPRPAPSTAPSTTAMTWRVLTMEKVSMTRERSV